MDKSVKSKRDALFEKGTALRDQGDYEGACRVYSLFIEEYPDDFAGYFTGKIKASL